MVGSRYLDSSALVKLIRAEYETPALRSFLDDDRPLVTSIVARVEIERAARRLRIDVGPEIETLFDRLVVVDLTAAIVAFAGRLEPPELRALDAIHLATALDLGEDVMAFVAYDSRLLAAARAVGLRVEHPGV